MVNPQKDEAPLPSSRNTGSRPTIPSPPWTRLIGPARVSLPVSRARAASSRWTGSFSRSNPMAFSFPARGSTLVITPPGASSSAEAPGK